MSRRATSAGLALAGAAALAGSFFGPLAGGGRHEWTDEQASAYSAATQQLHLLSFASPTPENRRQLEQVEAEYQDLRAQLERAQAARPGLGWALRVAGAGLILAAAVAAFLPANKPRQKARPAPARRR